MKLVTSLNKNIFYLAILQGSYFILPLLTFPYLVRVLGPYSFGLLGFCQATMQYLVMVTDYGFNWSATQDVSKSKNDKEKLTTIFWNVFFSKIILALSAIVIFFGITFFIKELYYAQVVLISFIPMVLGNILYPVWFFQGLEKMKWITLCSLSARLLLIPLTFLLVKNPQDIWLAALIQGGVNFIAGLIGFAIIINNNWIGKLVFDYDGIIYSLKSGWHIFISTAAISLYTTTTVVVLGFICGPVSVGYFNAANTIRNAAQSLMNPIYQAVYPRINSLFEENYAKSMNLLKKSFKGVLFISFSGSLLLCILSPIIIRYGVGDKYTESISILRILAFLPFIISLSNFFGIQTMLTHGYKRQFSKILLICGVMHVIIIAPLIFFAGAYGAAMTVLITEIVVASLMYLFLKRKKINLFK